MKETLTNWLTGPGGILRVRSLLALGITAAVMWMYIDGINVAEPIIAVWGGVVAYYFSASQAE